MYEVNENVFAAWRSLPPVKVWNQHPKQAYNNENSVSLTTATIPGWEYFASFSRIFSWILPIVSSSATGSPVSSQNLIISFSSWTGSWNKGKLDA